MRIPVGEEVNILPPLVALVQVGAGLVPAYGFGDKNRLAVEYNGYTLFHLLC